MNMETTSIEWFMGFVRSYSRQNASHDRVTVSGSDHFTCMWNKPARLKVLGLWVTVRFRI